MYDRCPMKIAPKPAQKKLSKKQAALMKALTDPNVPTIKAAGEIAGYKSRHQSFDAVQSRAVQEALDEFNANFQKDVNCDSPISLAINAESLVAICRTKQYKL